MRIPQIKLDEFFAIEVNNRSSKSDLLEMIWIPPGRFKMGSPNADEFSAEKQIEIEISNGFWLSKYPVTVLQWVNILDLPEPDWGISHFDHPITSVNWYQSMMFCWELNRLIGKNYFLDGYQFTLPLDAQWEYACRATTQSKFYNGDDESKLGEIAWYSANSDGAIHPVGEKKPNKWGFYDMLGNVYEWCLDTFAEQPQLPIQDSWSDPEYSYRVIRGGCYLADADHTCCAKRGYQYPINAVKVFGFRVCLSNLKYKLDL